MNTNELKLLLDKKKDEPKSDTARESILRATGRTENPNDKPTRSAADVIAGAAAFKQFLQLKDSL